MNGRVIKVMCERNYNLAPYQQLKLAVEVEYPDLSISDDRAITGAYLDCVARLDAAYEQYRTKPLNIK